MPHSCVIFTSFLSLSFAILLHTNGWFPAHFDGFQEHRMSYTHPLLIQKMRRAVKKKKVEKNRKKYDLLRILMVCDLTATLSTEIPLWHRLREHQQALLFSLLSLFLFPDPSHSLPLLLPPCVPNWMWILLFASAQNRHADANT